AVYFCSRRAAMQMIKTHCGAIVNVSSMWGEVGASCETLYSMSKAGVIGLTKALAKELAPSGITVNCVSPGIIDTRMNQTFSKEELAEEVPLERLGSSDEVASAILFLAENSYITGQNLSVNGGTVI
ncbi:MAG: SDR family oxidoreductase, partial [Eubacterium sp.]|nr:SDR family oxidoreductase [Eubacterium sp.]